MMIVCVHGFNELINYFNTHVKVSRNLYFSEYR